MITIKKVQGEIFAIESMPDMAWAELTKMQVNARKKRLSFLKLMRRYLETGPTEAFVQKEADRLEALLNALDQRYIDIPDKPKDEREFMKDFKKEYGYKEIKDKIKALKYILTGE